MEGSWCRESDIPLEVGGAAFANFFSIYDIGAFQSFQELNMTFSVIVDCVAVISGLRHLRLGVFVVNWRMNSYISQGVIIGP